MTKAELKEILLPQVKEKMKNNTQLNKQLAEYLIGDKLTEEDYMYQIGENIRPIVDDWVNGLTVCNDALLTNCNSSYVSKNGISSLIKHLQKLLDNYDIESLESNNRDIFASKCVDLLILNTFNEIGENNSKKEKECEDGFLYIMKNCGHYKIGISNNCYRLGEYTKLPEQPEYALIGYFKGYRKREQFLQKKYAKERLRDGQCEWFDLSDSQLYDIVEYLKKYHIECDFNNYKYICEYVNPYKFNTIQDYSHRKTA